LFFVDQNFTIQTVESYNNAPILNYL